MGMRDTPFRIGIRRWQMPAGASCVSTTHINATPAWRQRIKGYQVSYLAMQWPRAAACSRLLVDMLHGANGSGASVLYLPFVPGGFDPRRRALLMRTMQAVRLEIDEALPCLAVMFDDISTKNLSTAQCRAGSICLAACRWAHAAIYVCRFSPLSLAVRIHQHDLAFCRQFPAIYNKP